MGKAGAPKRADILNAIVLVFSHSRLKELVGTDALRSVLSGQYRDLVVDDTMHLQIIWDLLADQPGFDEADAKPAFAVLKKWEEDFHLKLEMPEAMKEMGVSELMASATQCQVPARVKERTFNPEAAKAKAKATMDEFDAGTPTPVTEESTRKPALEAILGLIAVGGLAFGGYSLVGFLSGPEINTVNAKDIRTEIPIVSATRLGGDLSIVANESWFGLPEAERKAMLERTLRTIGPLKLTALLVLDGAGAVRASAQWVGEPPKIYVRFR